MHKNRNRRIKSVFRIIPNDSIENIRKNLIYQYSCIMLIFILLFFTLFSTFYHDKLMIWYTGLGLLILGIFILTFRTRHDKMNVFAIVTLYLLLAPVYNMLIMLYFKEKSVASFSWLTPIPIGAPLFFGKRKTVLFSLYALITVLTTYILEYFFHVPNLLKQSYETFYLDTLIIIINILLIILLVIYREKIFEFKTREANRTVITFSDGAEGKLEKNIMMPDEKDAFRHCNKEEEIDNIPEGVDPAVLESIFQKIENALNGSELFKNPQFSLSQLCALLHINSTYVSKAIRSKGYTNFKAYLNYHRINYLTDLIDKTDLNKVTLMSLCKEAGFNNQSTFNRAFKQIKGITPSEYLTYSPNTISNNENPSPTSLFGPE